MEKNEHISYFKVKNFKRFEEFEMNDITQFNIIVGDNNVGKTTLLEALLFSDNIDEYYNSLINCFLYKFSQEFLRNEKIKFKELVKNILILFFNDKSIKKHTYNIKTKSGIKKELKFEIKSVEELSEKEIEFLSKLRYTNANPQEDIFILKDKSGILGMKTENMFEISKNTYFSYIPFSLGYNDDLTGFYSKHIQQNKERKTKFVNSLKSFIPDIESVEITTRFMQHPVIEVFEKSSNELKLLSTYGDGANKLFRILSEIIVSKGKRLMIDEIDTGIHYSRFEEFWKIILKTAREYDVQLYATTHNPDCLKYLVNTLENEDMQSYQKDTSIFALDELPDKTVKAFKYDYNAFSFSIKKGIEIRGGSNE